MASRRQPSVDYLCGRYQETKNPIFVWEAYLEARREGYNAASAKPAELPSWVWQYFDRVAGRFANMSRQAKSRPYAGRERRVQTSKLRTADHGPERRIELILDRVSTDDPIHFTRPTKGQIDYAVYRALEFCPMRGRKGRVNPFVEISRASRDFSIACAVYQCQTTNRHYSWRAVYEEVADEYGIGWKTVERLWRRHAREVIPPHILDKSPKTKKVADILR